MPLTGIRISIDTMHLSGMPCTVFLLILCRSLGQLANARLLSEEHHKSSSDDGYEVLHPHHRPRHAPSEVDLFKNTFSQIYSSRTWGEGGRGSGPGSSLAATEVTRAIVRTVVANYSISTMIDAPCGKLPVEQAQVLAI